MATHWYILAWEIPWTEEPGGLQSTGLQIVRHNLATKQQQRGTSKTFFFFLISESRLAYFSLKVYA